MTRILDQPQAAGGVRVLILGGGAYPMAATQDPKRPTLADVSSASLSATVLVERILGPWREQFTAPLASIDLLANSPGEPDGLTIKDEHGHDITVEPPTLANIRAAKTRWLDNAGRDDVLVFYCCGHGVWLPSAGQLFLATDFGSDPDSPWSSGIDLDALVLGLSEKPPRQQWLVFDCCANVPSEAMRAIAARPDSLISARIGGRQQAELLHGALAQVVLASATQGAQAFGRDGGPSRLTEAFVEACDDSGFMANQGGRWWVDSGHLEKAISTYATRVATRIDAPYFTFPRVVKTDAVVPPRLMGRAFPARCTLVVTSSPESELLDGDLTVTETGTPNILASQAPGPGSVSPFRAEVEPWKPFDARLVLGANTLNASGFTMPPLAAAEL